MRSAWGRILTAVIELILLAVVVGGILARFLDLFLYVSHSGDEWGNTIAPFRVLYERGNPGSFYHPSLFYYTTAATYAAVYAVVKAIGGVGPAASMTDVFFQDERIFVFAARGVSAACAALTLWVLYRLGRSLWRRQDGLAGAALLAVLPLHLLYSKTVRVDSLFLLVFLCAFTRIVRLLTHPDPRAYATAGLWTGLATGANYNGAVLLAWLVGAHFLSRSEASARAVPGHRPPGVILLCRALALAAVGFFVSSPFVFLNFSAFLQNFGFIGGLSLSEHPGWEGRGVLFYVAQLAHASPCLAVLFAVASLAVVFFGNRTERFVLSLPVGYLVVFSLLSTKDTRFVLPAAACLPLIAGGLPLLVARPLSSRPRLRMLSAALAYVLLFLCIGATAFESWHPSQVEPQETRLRPDRLLLNWIDANVPARSTILVEAGIVPWIDTLKEPGRFAAALRESVVAAHPNLDQRFLGAVYVGGRNYDPGALTQQHIDYAIIAPRNVVYIESHCDLFPEVCSFYAELRARARLAFETPPEFEPALIYEILH